MNLQLVTEGDIGVGALVLRMAIDTDRSVTGMASPIYALAGSDIDTEMGLVRIETPTKLSERRLRIKAYKLNILSVDATIVFVSGWTPFVSCVINFAISRTWHPVTDKEQYARGGHQCLVLYPDSRDCNTEDIAVDISIFLRRHRPKRLYVCGSAEIERGERLVAALNAGLKSAESFH